MRNTVPFITVTQSKEKMNSECSSNLYYECKLYPSGITSKVTDKQTHVLHFTDKRIERREEKMERVFRKKKDSLCFMALQ